MARVRYGGRTTGGARGIDPCQCRARRRRVASVMSRQASELGDPALIGRVLAAVDGSEAAWRALDFACDLAGKYGAVLVLVSVAPTLEVPEALEALRRGGAYRGAAGGYLPDHPGEHAEEPSPKGAGRRRQGGADPASSSAIRQSISWPRPRTNRPTSSSWAAAGWASSRACCSAASRTRWRAWRRAPASP